MKPISLLALAGSLVLAAPRVAEAAVHEAAFAPQRAVLLPADESGTVGVALHYDLSGLEAGELRHVVRAAVEWTVPGVAEEEECLIEVHPVEASWTAAGVGAGTESLTVSGTPCANWAIESRDYARHGSFAKFLVTDLVDAWASGSSANHGLLVTLSGVDREALANLTGATLKIRYVVE